MKLLLIPFVAIGIALFVAAATMSPLTGLLTFVGLQAAYMAVRVGLGIVHLAAKPKKRIVRDYGRPRVYTVR